MIQINDISIDLKAENLVIDAEIPLGDEGFINHIYIDTQNSYLSTGPSEDLVYEQDITIEDAKDECNSVDENENVRKIRIKIPQESICASLKSNLFIVYLEDNEEKITVGITMWMRPLYNHFLAWIREIGHNCEIPRNFIYLYLQYQAFIVSVRTCNIMEALKIYNKYFHRIQFPGNSSGCNCRR